MRRNYLYFCQFTCVCISVLYRTCYNRMKDIFSDFISNSTRLHQRLSGSAHKTGRKEVPDSVTDRACRPSRWEFSGIFFKTLVNRSQDPLERSSWRALLPQSQDHRVIIGLIPTAQLNPTQLKINTLTSAFLPADISVLLPGIKFQF